MKINEIILRAVDIVFPFLAVLLTNTITINRKIKEYGQKEKSPEYITECYDKVLQLKKSRLLVDRIFDIYKQENERRKRIEDKAISLLSVSGVIIAISTIIGQVADKKYNICHDQIYILMITYIVSLIEFVFAIISAIFASSIYKMRPEPIPGENYEDNEATHILQILRARDYNIYPILKKSNWVDSAQRHFVYGIIILVISIIMTTIFILQNISS